MKVVVGRHFFGGDGEDGTPQPSGTPFVIIPYEREGRSTIVVCGSLLDFKGVDESSLFLGEGGP